MNELFQVILGLAALGVVPIAMIIALALFERRDGRSRYVVVDGKVRRRDSRTNGATEAHH